MPQADSFEVFGVNEEDIQHKQNKKTFSENNVFFKRKNVSSGGAEAYVFFFEYVTLILIDQTIEKMKIAYIKLYLTL